MNQQPKTVVCASCNAKFHVPDELIRGKLVKFRCRKCGSAFDVDGRARGRTGAEPPFRNSEPSFRQAEPVATVDTPAAFSQPAPFSRPPSGSHRSAPPPPPPPAPPVDWTGKSSANLQHPWPEPPRGRSTMPPPVSISESLPPEASLPQLEAVRDPSNRGPKIAAVAALLIAAGLSGVGLAIRSPAPGTVASHEPQPSAEPVDPQPAPQPRAAADQRRGVDPSALTRAPTAITDLPVATDSVERAHGGAAAAAPALVAPSKPADIAAKQGSPPELPSIAALVPADEPAAVAAPAASNVLTPGGALAANNDIAAHAGNAAEPSAAKPQNAPEAPPAAPGAAIAPGAANIAVPPGAAPPAVANPTPPAPVARSRGDFNTQAAREALEDAAARASKCKTIDTPSGTARVAVTFAPNGQATNAVIESGPFVGTSAGTCVAAKFKAARVPSFTGDSVLVRKSVPF
ncbi:MAG: zinc-ribbon domain-containing protein [Polyangiaceae bacterium]